MVLHPFALGVSDRAFNGVKLLREVDAGPTLLDHDEDRGEMAISAPQAFGDIGMGVVRAISYPGG